MTTNLDHVAAAVAGLRRRVSADLHGRGPVPLAAYFGETALDHVELPALTRGAVAEYLRHEGVPAADLGAPADRLAGFVFTAERFGWAFVNADDPLPRRRFSAAHELGHFILHRETMGQVQADTDETLEAVDGHVADQMEREANRFAVELLMPADVCQARARELRHEHGCCPQGVLVYRLASELLVSRAALRYRLKALEVGNE